MTKTQLETLEFIAEFTDGHGYPPTLRDIALGCGDLHQNAICDRLKPLKRDGLVTSQPKIARSLILTALGKETVARCGKRGRP